MKSLSIEDSSDFIVEVKKFATSVTVQQFVDFEIFGAIPQGGNFRFESFSQTFRTSTRCKDFVEKLPLRIADRLHFRFDQVREEMFNPKKNF